MEVNEKEHLISAIPERKWMILFFLLWLLLGFIPILLVVVGGTLFSIATDQELSVAGTIGDAFGFVNSIFSTAALLFVVWSLKIQRQEVNFSQKEWHDNTRSQQYQAELMQEASYLTATNHIFQHFNNNFGSTDTGGLLRAIAEGHRKWSIFETFRIIDKTFSEIRIQQVENELNELKGLLATPSVDKNYLSEVSKHVACLVLESSISQIIKDELWRIYHVLTIPQGDNHVTNKSFGYFESLCKNFILRSESV